jgi:hypothetical protein
MQQKRLAAGLRPDPLGEFTRSPDSLAVVGVAWTPSGQPDQVTYPH